MKLISRILLILYIIIYVTLAALYNFGVIDFSFLYSALIAGILNIVNSLIAILLFEYSYKKGGNVFLLANLGGMGARMVFMLVSILVIMKFFKIHEIGFLLIFFIIYFILLSSEVFYFHKKTKNKNI